MAIRARRHSTIQIARSRRSAGHRRSSVETGYGHARRLACGASSVNRSAPCEPPLVAPPSGADGNSTLRRRNPTTSCSSTRRAPAVRTASGSRGPRTAMARPCRRPVMMVVISANVVFGVPKAPKLMPSSAESTRSSPDWISSFRRTRARSAILVEPHILRCRALDQRHSTDASSRGSTTAMPSAMSDEQSPSAVLVVQFMELCHSNGKLGGLPSVPTAVRRSARPLRQWTGFHAVDARASPAARRSARQAGRGPASSFASARATSTSCVFEARSSHQPSGGADAHAVGGVDLGAVGGEAVANLLDDRELAALVDLEAQLRRGDRSWASRP